MFQLAKIVRASRAMANRNGCPCTRVRPMRSWTSGSGVVFGEMHHGILADFETATGLRSSRVAFCFSFRHSWKTVAQIS